MKRTLAILVVGAMAVVAVVRADAEKIDYQMLTKIRDEGLNRSQAMEIESWIADVYGPRMTGSPGYKQAADWAVKKMTASSASRTCTSRSGPSARAGS